MGEAGLGLAVIVFVVAFALGATIVGSNAQQRLESERQTWQQRVESEKRESQRRLEDEKEKWKQIQLQREGAMQRYHDQRERTFQQLVEQSRGLYNALEQGMLSGRRWLANAFSEFVDTRNLELECWLAVKPQTAQRAAEQVAELRQKHRASVEQMKLLEYQLASYEEYFPFLNEYRDAILDEAVDLRRQALEALEGADPALSHGYLSKDEYDRLPTVDKFQLAVDRYWARRKNSWQIGRLYERYIGYLHESQGWRVAYQGIVKGFEDFGRDLVCVKGQTVRVVQCKCWAKEKFIREKHVFQLYGTTVLFRMNPERELGKLGFGVPASAPVIEAVFAATAPYSDEAKEVARFLGIELQATQLPKERYPMIKCNINPGTGERIYHLPFDQQYDKVVIGNVPGEFYAANCRQAEEKGFRRAFRWGGTREGADAEKGGTLESGNALR